MNITIVGTGYVGLVTAAVLARLGNKVWGLDVNKTKIKSLQRGQIPFYEPGLKELVEKNMARGKLTFTNDYQKAVPEADVVFICVGTPPKKDGDYNLSFVFGAAKSIGKALKKYTVVVIKSTVPPNTGKKVKEIIKKITQVPFDIASCPEFLREGSAVEDSLHPSRVVIGTESERAKNILLELHKAIKSPLVLTDLPSAQLIKYAANAFLATKISFINSIALICDKVGADVLKVSEGLGLDPRIGKAFLQAGIGYGGSCFPKDTWALISFAKRLNYDFAFLKQVDEINKIQIDYFVEKIERLLGGSLKNKTVTILGLSFKPQTDDLREACSIPLIKKLQQKGVLVRATDPVAIKGAERIFNNVKFYNQAYEALKGSEALLLVTEWQEYKNLDFAKIKKLMKKPVLVDGRNFLPMQKIKKLGFIYEGIGIR